MTKQSKITNLLVVPLIASAVFLASPAFASNTMRTIHTAVRNITSKESIPNVKKGVLGTVTSVNGSIIIVTSKDGNEYTVDAAHATIMKGSSEANSNPSIVTITDVKLGDWIVARGTLNDKELSASKIFDGKILLKNKKHQRNHTMHALKKK